MSITVLLRVCSIVVVIAVILCTVKIISTAVNCWSFVGIISSAVIISPWSSGVRGGCRGGCRVGCRIVCIVMSCCVSVINVSCVILVFMGLAVVGCFRPGPTMYTTIIVYTIVAQCTVITVLIVHIRRLLAYAAVITHVV